MIDHSQIKYPYLPSGKSFKYVAHDNEFMIEARDARQRLSGDPSYPVGAVLVKDGRIIAKVGNGYNQGKQIHICPRIVLECPSGTGYELCKLHDDPGHAEQMAVKIAQEQGIEIKGADLYMYGHWWACEPCWNKLINAGVRDVYLVDDAHERFSRDKVYTECLTPSIQSVYISGALSNLPEDEKAQIKLFYENLACACREIGCSAYVPHLKTDPDAFANLSCKEVFDIDVIALLAHDVIVSDVTYPSLGVGGELILAQQAGKKIILLSQKGSKVSRFALGNPAVVYHAEYDDHAQACRFLKNILRQL
jgi:deoxycytidylate deaminase